jgi:DNA-binding NarL/FixJ family response regulator
VRAHLGEAAFARSLAEGRGLTAEDLLAIPHPAAPGAPAPVLPALESLTPRETEVLALLAEGLSNPQIAERLVVSRRTVDAHLQHVYDKLGVHSRDAAVRAAQDLGLIERR